MAPAAVRVEAMRVAQPRGPYHIAGYSLGGLLAYEIARQLRAAGEEVAWLCLLDTAAPPAVAHHLSLGREIERGWCRGTLPALCLRLRSAISRRRQFRALLVDGFDADGAIKLGLTYRFRAGDVPLHVFASRAHREKIGSVSLGWIDVHRGPVEVHEILGDH